MFRLTNLLCTFVSLAMVLGLTTPVLAGPTSSPTPAPTASPTPAPNPECTSQWPVTSVFTVGKGQKPATNNLLKHEIVGHIIDPGSVKATQQRIFVCENTFVTAIITSPGGFCAGSVTPTGTLDCGGDCHTCEGTINRTEVYTAVNQTGSDKDRIQIVPR